MSDKINFNGKDIELRLNMTKIELRSALGISAEDMNTIWKNVDSPNGTMNMLDSFEEIAKFKQNFTKYKEEKNTPSNPLGLKLFSPKPLDKKVWTKTDEEIDTTGFNIEFTSKDKIEKYINSTGGIIYQASIHVKDENFIIFRAVTLDTLKSRVNDFINSKREIKKEAEDETPKEERLRGSQNLQNIKKMIQNSEGDLNQIRAILYDFIQEPSKYFDTFSDDFLNFIDDLLKTEEPEIIEMLMVGIKYNEKNPPMANLTVNDNVRATFLNIFKLFINI